MHRRPLLDLLTGYETSWAAGALPYATFSSTEERTTLTRLRSFIQAETQCFERSCAEGHITASALVTDPSCELVLLTLHAKLNKWLQLGGHVDSEEQVHKAALREAQEESGRDEVAFLPYERILSNCRLSPLPFDIDIHLIPARKNDAAHFHFDIRFLCLLDPQLPFVISEESQDLRWMSLSDAVKRTDERSMQRQFFKLKALRQALQAEQKL